MKVLLPLLALIKITTVNASLVAVMDSGTDISHKDLAPKVWVNSKERIGSTLDLDNDGLPGNVYGWDYTTNNAKVFDPSYNFLINDNVKRFYDYYSKYELGLLTSMSPEVAWLKEHTQDKDLMNKVNFIGAYIHGTHVTGISLNANPTSKVLSMKIIPTIYQELPSKPSTKNPNGFNKNSEPPTKTYDEVKAGVIEDAEGQIQNMTVMHTMINFHKVDVVNQSFGIGYGDAQNFIRSAFIQSLKREPTDAELRDLVVTYFRKLLIDGPRMFNVAPNTLFVIAAGNDNSNNDLYPDYPADIQVENKIVVAATLGYKKLADFSNYGATKVDIAAPGVAITSTAPNQNYIALSGTSQATPYVTGVIAAVKDTNNSLSARDIKAIIFGTVDYKSWLKGKVKTSGIINRSRALKAAEFSKTMSLDKAISNARAHIMDVQIPKAFSGASFNIGFKFVPKRASLLIAQ